MIVLTSRYFKPDHDYPFVSNNIIINNGDAPPVLSGQYQTSGQVTNTSPNLSALIGTPMNSLVCLYNQTNTGKLRFISQGEPRAI